MAPAPTPEAATQVIEDTSRNSKKHKDKTKKNSGEKSEPDNKLKKKDRPPAENLTVEQQTTLDLSSGSGIKDKDKAQK